MHTILGYIGPDTMLPAASVAAALLGGVLFAWRWIVAFFARVWRAATGRTAPPGAATVDGAGDPGRPGPDAAPRAAGGGE